MKNIILSLLVICGVCLAGQVNAQHKNCPSVAGHYRVAGFGPVLGDALKVWGAEMAGFTDSEVKITGNANQSLSLFLKSGNSGAMSSTPNRIWRINVNYRCDSGTIVFMQRAASARQLENGWYEGKTEIRIAPDSSRGLAINAFFSGHQRTTLFSYDSARISIPKLGTGKSFSDGIRFPNISEPAPAKNTDVATPEPASVVAVRGMLTHSMLGAVMLGAMQEKGDAVLVTFNAKSGEDAAQFEDRLHEALIAYEMKTAPIWTNNNYYFNMLMRTKRAENRKTIKYSTHRVLIEMQKINHPMVDASEVIEQDDAFLVTLQVLQNVSADDIIASLKRNSSLVADAKLVSDSVSPQSAKLRVVQLSVSLR